MRSRTLAILVLGGAAACTPQRAQPLPASDGDPFSPIERHYAARAVSDGWPHYILQPTDSEYVRRFRAQSSGSAELREYLLHVHFRPDDPDAHGAKSLDERLIARAFEATPFPEWDVDKMVELAHAQRLKLRGIDDVRWFLHADAQLGGSEVASTDSPRRFRFRQRKSGAPDETAWRTLVLDDDGVQCGSSDARSHADRSAAGLSRVSDERCDLRCAPVRRSRQSRHRRGGDPAGTTRHAHPARIESSAASPLSSRALDTPGRSLHRQIKSAHRPAARHLSSAGSYSGSAGRSRECCTPSHRPPAS
jgi:hypothetical protein